MLGQNDEINYRTTVTDGTAQGVNSTLQSVSRVDDAYARLEKREASTSKQAQELRKSFDRVARSADPLARAQQRTNKQLEIAKKALREGVVSTKEYDRTVKSLNQRLKNAEARAKGSNRQFRSMGATLRFVASAAAAAGLSFSAMNIGREAVNTAASFQQQMANVASTTQAAGGELQALGRQARDLGASTAFSASEAAAGMEELSLAGFKTNEIVASIGGTLDLAAAGQLGLARASEISASVLRGFNLEAAESNRVSDVLAAAATRSNQRVEALGEAMKFAAPNARLFGISLEETTASISKLADAGLKGGLGGRGFQALTTRLVKERDKIEAIIGDFDVAEEGLTSVLKRLGEANISNAQAIEIFSAENLDVFSVLSTAARDAANGTDKFTESLMNARGEAERIAKIKFTTFRGVVDELGGAREELFLEFAGGELGRVAEGAGALPAIERTIIAITEAMRSDAARQFAKDLGEGVGGALDELRENWSAVVNLTEAATAAAVLYGAAAGSVALVKVIGAIQSKIAAQAASNATDRAAAVAALNTAKAESAAATASLNRARQTAATAVVVRGSTTADLARAATLKQITALETAAAASSANLARAKAGLAATNAMATRSMLSTIGAATGLKAALAAITSPVSIFVGLTAAIFLFGDELDGSKRKLQEFDDALSSAFEAAGEEFPDRLKKGLDQSRRDLERFEADYRRILASINNAARDEFEDARRPNPTASLAGDLQNIRRDAAIRNRNAQRAREAAAAAAVTRERFGDVPIGVFPRGFEASEASLNAFNREVKAFDLVATSAEAKAAALGVTVEELTRQQNGAADSAREAARAEESFGKAVASQAEQIQKQIDRLQTLNKARGEGRSDQELDALKRRLDLEEQYSELIAAQGKGRVDALIALEKEAALQQQRRDNAEAISEAQRDAARAAADALADEQQRFADTATDLMVDIWRSFRREGTSAIDTIKDYLRTAMDNVIGGLFQNLFNRIFTGSAGGPGGSLLSAGFNPAQLAGGDISITNVLSGSGAQTVAPSGAGVAALVAQANGAGARPATGAQGIDQLFGFSKVFGENGSLAQAGRRFGDVLGLGEKGIATFGKLARGAGTGFAVSQGVNLVGDLLGFGSAGNTGSTIGGTAGGVLGSVIPGVGTVVGSIVGSTVGKIFGSLFGRKTATGAVDLSTGEVFGVRDSKKDSRNERRDEVLSGAGNAIASIADIIGGEIASGVALQVDAGKKRIEAEFVDAYGRVIASAGAVDDKDVQGAVAGAIRTAITQVIEGGNESLGAVASALATAQRPADAIATTLGRLSELIAFDDEPASRFSEALDIVNTSFADARRAAGAYGGELAKLAADQRKVTEAIASRFDEDIASQLRQLTDPLSQQAIDLAELQRQRIADATAINDALAASPGVVATTGSSSSAAGAPAAFAGYARFFNNAIDGAERYRVAIDQVAESMAATAAAPANDNAAAEAQERLRQVVALNTAEWKAFIEQASNGVEGLAAAAEAMAAMREELLGLGLDLETVESQISEVRSGLASAFDESISEQLLAITAPSEAAALDLIQTQTDRIESAKSVSAGAADEQERLSRVIALNTAEWRQFIDQASSTPEALAAAAAAIDRFAEQAQALGADPALLRSQVSDARALLAAEIDQDTSQRLLNIANPALAQFNQLLKEQTERLRIGESVGANTTGIETLNALERQKFLSGLSDEDRIGLGDFLGVIEDQSGRLSFVLSDLRLAFESQITNVDRLTAQYEESASAWRAANDNVRSSLGDIRREFRGGDLQTQLDTALQRFDTALATATQPAADEAARTSAQGEIGGLGREALNVARELYGTAPQFQTVFDRIESGLTTALGSGVAIEENALSQAEIARSSLEALRRIDNALSQPSLDLPVLEESRDQLRALNDNQTAFLDRMDELISLERQRESQAALSVGALSQVNAPLTPNSGDPVRDAQTAQEVAAAVLQTGEATVQAVSVLAEMNGEDSASLEQQIIGLRQDQQTMLALLRRIAEALEAGSVAA